METLQSLRSFSLLIVEDDKAASKIIANLIGMEFPGCTIYTADNGITGLELFKEYAPDIVITDVNMPVMDGVELARAIRSINADATYIVLTAYSDNTVFEKFREIGVCAYLLKPINFSDLFAAIERCRVEG
jgi:YesN/AraC family two-component response regulator